MSPLLAATPVVYEAFRKRFYYDEWPDRQYENVDIARTTPFPPSLSATPTSQFPYWIKSKTPCDLMKTKGEINLPGPNPNTHFYWFIPTSVPGFVPSRSDENLLAVVHNRVLVAPPMEPVLQARAWRNMDPLVRQFEPIVRDHWVEPWYSHFTDALHKKRYRRALDVIQDQGLSAVLPCCDKIKVMVKCDELLTKTEPSFGSDQFVMKPRLIANINELPQTWVGPELYAATINLKLVWSVVPDPIFLGQIPVYITYGGACDDAQLTEWAQFALISKTRAWHIIVAGDDSLVIEWWNGTLRVVEGDASMFDQSQSFGPLEFEYQCQRRLGLSELAIQLMRKLNAAPYVAISRDKQRLGKLTIDRSQRPIRDTGGGNTSVGNSLVMAHAIVHALLHDRTDLISGFKQLGLDMKIKYLPNIMGATFLKGMWYRVDSDFGYFWGPLPSRILKVGKSLRDPLALYKSHTKDFAQAARMFLNDVACGYQFFIAVPLVRVFVKNFLYRDMIRNEVEPYHVHASVVTKPNLHEDVWFQLEDRYAIRREWFFEAEALYPSQPFNFVEHPIYFHLNRVDYN